MAKMISSLSLGCSPSTPSFYRPSSLFSSSSSSSVAAVVRCKPIGRSPAKSSFVYKNSFVCARVDKKKWMIPKAGEMEGESEEIETEAETETEGESEFEIDAPAPRKEMSISDWETLEMAAKRTLCIRTFVGTSLVWRCVPGRRRRISL